MRILEGHRRPPSALAFAPGDPGLGPVRALAFAADGMTAAVAGGNRHDIVVFDVEAD